MTRLEALVGLNLILDIGSIRLKKLLESFDKPENIIKTPAEKLVRVSGIGEKIAQRITSIKSQDIKNEFTQAKKLGLDILTFEDEAYPQNLKNIPDPPIILYVKGKLKEEDKNALAVVGSRQASIYGLNNAEKFSFSLSARGFTIVSGMARGIDTYGHRGALKARGRTIAVIGSGFNQLYPPENKGLAEQIAQNGAVISEFPLNTEPFKQNFPRRNRVISALSLGVLVVEAARNSGALITADFALEYGREVFALPGKVDSDNAFGTNELIKQGAKLVTCVDDILEEFSVAKEAKASKGVRPSVHNPGTSASKEELSLLDLISEESVQLDELIEKTNMEIPEISDILLKLQLKKLIKQLPGKHFVRSSG